MSEILLNRQVDNQIIVPINLTFDENGKAIRVTEDYIDIGYSGGQSQARLLSNLFPYQFIYFGCHVNSIEAVIQSLKYADEDLRRSCFTYADRDALDLRGMEPYAWQQDGILYTPAGPINRFSEEYQDFLDRLYLMVFKNHLYRHYLKGSSPKMLDHTIGEDNPQYTTLTRTEYISRLYALRYYLINEGKNKENPEMVLKKVRQEVRQEI